MIALGDFLKSFVKYANETPNALVYTDLAPWESGNSAYCYVKSLMLKDGAQQDPSLQLLVDSGGESLPVDRDEVDEVLEYDQQDPKEIFFYTDTGYDDD